jgi:AcrR family transcriptional regulator
MDVGKREERRRLRRRAILAGYYQVLLDEGLEGASIAKIAKQVAVQPSLIIHYFGTKEQLTIELVDYLLEVYYEEYGARLAAIEDPSERLLTILDTLFSVEYQQLLDDKVFYACFYISLRHPTVRQAFATLARAELDLLEGAVDACMAQGAIPRDDPHELATVVKALEAGYAFLIGGGADEELAAAVGKIVKARAFKLLGLFPADAAV